jgi:hypothetical protein
VFEVVRFSCWASEVSGRTQKMIAAIIEARLAGAVAGDEPDPAFFGRGSWLNVMKICGNRE